jgi:hypothetical protein
LDSIYSYFQVNPYRYEEAHNEEIPLNIKPPLNTVKRFYETYEIGPSLHLGGAQILKMGSNSLTKEPVLIYRLISLDGRIRRKDSKGAFRIKRACRGKNSLLPGLIIKNIYLSLGFKLLDETAVYVVL